MAPQPQLSIDQQRALAKARARAKARSGGQAFSGVLKPGAEAPTTGPAIDLNRPRLENDDGSFSTEETITVSRGGKWYNVPTIINGQRVDPSLVESAFERGDNIPHVGEYASLGEAEREAQARTQEIGRVRRNEPPALLARPADPAFYDRAAEAKKQDDTLANRLLHGAGQSLTEANRSVDKDFGGVVSDLGHIAAAGGQAAAALPVLAYDYLTKTKPKQIGEDVSRVLVETTGAGQLARLQNSGAISLPGAGRETGATTYGATGPDYDPALDVAGFGLGAATAPTRATLGAMASPRSAGREAVAALQDAATNVTMGASDLVGGGVNAARRGINGLTSPRPSPAPLTSVPPTSRRPAQPGPAGAGQQPGAPPVINAVPATPVVTKGQQRVARDTAKILGRIMRSSRIKDADIRGYLPGAIQRFKSLNDSRVPFAFFLEGDLPNHFPGPIAEEVTTKLRTWGRERNAATGPQDTSRNTTQQTVKGLRESQQDFLTAEAERNLYKGSLIGKEDQILRSLRETGRKGYEPTLAHARDAMEGRRVPTPDERAGFEQLREVLQRSVFRDRIPNDVKLTAEAEGLDLTELIERDPVTAAHWLQSNLRKLEDAAEDIGGKATPASLAYARMRDAVLEPLKKAAPGYEGAMKRYGHEFGAKEAVDFGRGLFTTARNARDSAKLVRKFKGLTKRQQTVALMSIRDELLNQFRGTKEGAAAKITRLQEEGTLELLEELGARGKRVADAVRKIAKENEQLRAIDQGSGSPTYSNIKGAESAREIVQSPINKAVGAFGDKTSWPMTVAGDVVLASSGLPPVLSLGKAATAAIDRFGNPSAKTLSRATEGLYGLPTPTNGLVAPPRAPRARRVAGPAPQPESPQDIGTLLRRLDEIEGDAKKRGGPEGAQLLKEIADARKQIAAGAVPAPGSPPERAGLPAGAPEAIGAGGGGAVGYAAAPDANGDGVVDPSERAAGALGGIVTGVAVGAGAGRGVRGARPPPEAARMSTPGELELSPSQRVFSPGRPDDLGFITSAEQALATPSARFRNAKSLTADQWRKLMREGGASNEAFEWQIEPALKMLADRGFAGDIPRAEFEEALARARGTLKTSVSTPEARKRWSKIPEDKQRQMISEGRPDVPERDYSAYVAPGPMKNYRQEVIYLPQSQGQGYKSHNWINRNPVGHIRTTDRVTADGRKVLHVEELQSDLHQEGAAHGYRGADFPANADMLRDQVERLARKYSLTADRYKDWRRGLDTKSPESFDIKSMADAERIADPVGREYARNMIAARDQWNEALRSNPMSPMTDNAKKPPRAPMQDWEEPFVRHALQRAAKEGYDTVTFPTNGTLNEALRNEGTGKFYDERLPKTLARVAKALGTSLTTETLGFSTQGNAGRGMMNVPGIRLTPEAKDILRRGVMMDASGNARLPVAKPEAMGFLPRGPKGPKPPEQRGAGGGEARPRGGAFNFSDETQVRKIGPAEIEYNMTPDGSLLIAGVDVPPAQRGQGYASAAIDRILKAADDEGLEVILDVAPPPPGDPARGMSRRELTKFYETRGFRLTDELDDFGRPDESRMVRKARKPKAQKSIAPPPKQGEGRGAPTNGLVAGTKKAKPQPTSAQRTAKEVDKFLAQQNMATLLKKRETATGEELVAIDAKLSAIKKAMGKGYKPPPPVLSKATQDLDREIADEYKRFAATRRKLGRFPDQRDAAYQAHTDRIADLERQRAESFARDQLGTGMKKLARQAYNAGPKIVAGVGLGAAAGVIGATGGVAAYNGLIAPPKKKNETKPTRIAPPEDTSFRGEAIRNSRNRQLVQQVQTQLNALGWRLAPDGIMLGRDGLHGAQTDTQKAIRRFQYENALPVTGLLDADTLDAIDAAYREQLNRRAAARRSTEAYQEAR